MLAKDIKRGSIVKYNDAPCMIESIAVQSPTARAHPLTTPGET